MAQMSKNTSIRLSPKDIELSDILADKLGLTRSGVVKMAIRRLAEREVVVPVTEEGDIRMYVASFPIDELRAIMAAHKERVEAAAQEPIKF